MMTSISKLSTLVLVIAVGVILGGCSHTEIAINENKKNQEEFVEGAKAIFASGEGPCFMAKKKTSSSSSVKSDAKQPIRKDGKR